MDLGHALGELRGQFAAAQMYIKKSRLDATVSRKSSDFVDVPVCSCKIRQAQMPRSMRSKFGNPAPFRDSFDDLGLGPYRYRLPSIAARFRDEEPATFAAELATAL
jgi:hypothetical protein